ncbi:MAG: SDR family NAD(P)-dependent oxidoreductase [Gemmatimonadales bacterium]
MSYTLITGASSGIGEALLQEFASHGHNVIAVSNDRAELERTVERHRLMHPQVTIVPLTIDLRSESAPAELHAATVAGNMVVDILVNDAGEGQLGHFAQVPIERDIQLIRLNVEALTRLTKLFLVDMLGRGQGKIMNVGSVAGFQPGPTLAVYHATKAYVVSLSEALAEELRDTPITITCLCPGPTDTGFFETADMEDTRVYRNKDQTMMDPADVASAGYDALMRGDRLVIPGAMNKVMTFTRRVIPGALQAKMQKRFYETTADAEA